jgi:hypothetical protein
MLRNRHLPALEYLAMKDTFHRLVEGLGGPHRAAAFTRVSAQMLSNYGNPNDDSFAPIDVVADLESEAAEPIVTRLLAGFVNSDVVMRPNPKANAETFFRHLGDTTRAGAKLTQAQADALEDARVDAAERKAICAAAAADVLENLELMRDCKAVL